MLLIEENFLTKTTATTVSLMPKKVTPVKNIHTPIVINVSQSFYVITALLDNNSEVNLISQQCVKELSLLYFFWEYYSSKVYYY